MIWTHLFDLHYVNPRTPWDWTTKNDLAYSNDLFFKIKIKKKIEWDKNDSPYIHTELFAVKLNDIW